MPENTQYLELLDHFWTESKNFHTALADGDTQKAKQYDDNAAGYQRKLSEMDEQKIETEFEKETE